MRYPVFATTVVDTYRTLSPDTDLRSEQFFRAVMEEVIKSGAFEIDTDGVDVAVSVQTL